MRLCDVVTWKRALRDRACLPAHAHHVAMTLTLWMARDGGFNGTPPSIPTIAHAMGKSVNQTRRGLRELAAAQWLELVEREGRPSMLHAALPDWFELDPFADLEPLPSEQGVGTEPLPSETGVTPTISNRGSSVTPTISDRGLSTTPPISTPNPSHLAPPKSSEVHISTISTSPLTRGPADHLEDDDPMMVRPEDRPDLWDQAKQRALTAPNVRNLESYTLAIFRTLVTAEHQQTTADQAQQLIDQCPHCTTNGIRFIDTEAGEVTVRCNHQDQQ